MVKSTRPTVKLEVIGKPLRYNTRRMLPGDTFEAHPKHAKAFILLKKVRPYRELDSVPQIPQKLVERVQSNPTALYGSSLLEATYQIGGKTVQLGKIVAGAHAKTELTPEQWNSLPTDTREALLADELKRLKTEAGEGDAPPDTTQIDTVEEAEEQNSGEGEGEGEGDEEKAADELAAARAEYKEVVGRAPYGGWDVAKIREKLEEAKKG